MKKYLSVVLTAAMAASVVAGCSRGGSGHSASSSGGGSSPIGAQFAEEMLNFSPFGTLHPAVSYNSPCGTSGTISVNDTIAYNFPDATHETAIGSLDLTYNTCVSGANTFTGGMTMNFNLNGLETPSTSSPTNVVVNGTIGLSANSVSINGSAPVVSGFTLTYTNLNFANANTSPTVTSGTLTYSGTVNGVSVSGTCNGIARTCT